MKKLLYILGLVVLASCAAPKKCCAQDSKFKTNLKLTSQENLLDQPRKIYGFRGDVKEYLTLNIGDVNPRISHFTMNGKGIRGLDVNLNLGWLNFQFIKGELKKVIRNFIDTFTWNIFYNIWTFMDLCI